MTQENIKAPTPYDASQIFREKHPDEEIYNVTRTHTKNTPRNERVYRVTGLPKNMIPPSKRIYVKRFLK